VVFVEVLPRLIVGGGDSVEVFRRPAVVENTGGDSLDELVQPPVWVVMGVR